MMFAERCVGDLTFDAGFHVEVDWNSSPASTLRHTVNQPSVIIGRNECL